MAKAAGGPTPLAALTAGEASELRGNVIERDLVGHIDERLELGAAQGDRAASFECLVEQK
jgi:hypothetical protein